MPRYLATERRPGSTPCLILTRLRLSVFVLFNQSVSLLVYFFLFLMERGFTQPRTLLL